MPLRNHNEFVKSSLDGRIRAAVTNSTAGPGFKD